MKYTIGAPLVFVLLLVHWWKRKDTRWNWLVQAGLAFILVFTATNPFLLTDPQAISYWSQRIHSLYMPGEDYYGKNIFYYYLEFLTRYNYGLSFLLCAGIGLIWSLAQDWKKAMLATLYPVIVYFWLCSFETRRVHGLLPLHPFLALWVAYAMEQIRLNLQKLSPTILPKILYSAVAAFVLFGPYYRTGVQSYLFSRVDNRSKAELWMTNRLPQGSRIAVLQFQQMELDPLYFQIEDFQPKDYVFDNKDFRWFRDHGFDYIAVSSGQYMRYFTEGEKAEKYREYFLRLFQEGSQKGTLVLDLITHPHLIPDYRIKVFSTKSEHSSAQFLPAIEEPAAEAKYQLTDPGTTLFLSPGYYSLEFKETLMQGSQVKVNNRKLEEMILQKKVDQASSAALEETRYPFAIFPVRVNSRFSLFSREQPELNPNQPIQFLWRDIPSGLVLKRIEPAIAVTSVEFSPEHSYDPGQPYLLFHKHESFALRCSLLNRSNIKVEGYVEGFLSEIGKPQPWKDFESAGGTQEFFLEGGQAITIEIPMNTETLVGDHQLSLWIFTRQDLPYSPQNGGWFNKQIRVQDPLLGIHPVYRIPIP